MNLTFMKRCFLLGFLLALGILDDRSFVVEGKENANSLQQATSKHFSYLSNGFQNKLIKSLSFLRIQKLLLLPSKDKKNNKTNKNTNSATSATTTTQKKQKQQKAPKASKETLTTEKTEEETKKETIESPEKVILPTTSLEKTQRRQDYFVQTIQFLYTIFTFYGVRIIMKLKSDNEQHQWILRMSFAGYLLFCILYYFLLKFFISQRYKYSSVIEFVNIPPSKNPFNSLLQQFLNPKNGTVEEGGKESELTQRLSSNPLFAMLQQKVTSPSTTPSITIKEYDHEQNLQLFKSLFQDILWVLGCIYVMKKNYFTLIYWTIMNGIKARLVQSPLFYIYFFRFQSIGLLSRPFKSSLEMMFANFQNSMEIKTEIQEELQKLPTVVSGSEGKVETIVSDSTLSTSSGDIPAPITEDHSENTSDGRNNEDETKNSKHEATKKKAKTKKSEKKDSKKKNKRDKKENHSNKTGIEEDLKSVGETEEVKDSTIESSSIQQSNPSSINNPPDTVIKSSTDTLPTQSETEPAKSDIISHPNNSPSLIAQRESDLPKQDLSKKIEQNESFPSISSSFSGISIEEAVNALPADSSLLTVTEEEEEEAEALSSTSIGTVFDDPVLANLETLEELDTNDEANSSAFIDDELDHLPIDDLEDFDDEEDENGAINELQPSEDIANDIEEAVSAEEKELVDDDDDELEDKEAGVSEELKEEDALEDSFQALDSLNHLMGSNDVTTTEEELDFNLTNYDETDHLSNDEEQTEETENVSEEAETTADEDDLLNDSLQGQMDDIESLLNSLNNDFKR